MNHKKELLWSLWVITTYIILGGSFFLVVDTRQNPILIFKAFIVESHTLPP